MILSMSSTLALSIRMGYKWDSRIFWQRVNPSMSGSITSKMAKLSSFWAMISKASAAVYAFRTGKPSFFR